MSREEIVSAYTEGRISRRTFIRSLVATGATLGAAVAYSTMLSVSPAAADPRYSDDYYDYYSHKHDQISDDNGHKDDQISNDNGHKSDVTDYRDFYQR